MYNNLSSVVGNTYILFILFFVFSVNFVFYFLKCYGLYVMAKNQKHPRVWMAWFPIIDIWLMGELIGPCNLFYKYKVKNIGELLVISNIIGIILSAAVCSLIPVVLAFLVFLSLTFLYYFYKRFSDDYVLFFIISIVLPFMCPIFIFILRNNQPKDILEFY